MAIKNLLIRGGADFSGVKKEMQKTQKALDTFQSSVSRTVKKIGAILGTIALGHVVKESTNMAMGVESAINNINRNMGAAAKSFQDFVNTQSKSLGIATADAYKYGSTYSNLLASFTSGAQETADKTAELMKATAIISSATGRTYEDTAERIRSGMLGSTEAIEDLGVYTNIAMIESTEAFRRFAGDKSWAQLDFQTQQQIRLAAILEQTYARYGDTIADTTQSRHASFIASLKNIQLSFGQAFLPIYNAVLPALTAMANAIGRVVNIIAQFSQALFGTPKQAQSQTQAVNQQVGAVEDLGKAYTGAGKAVKKAQGFLAGFDEVNAISESSSSGSGTDSDGLLGGVSGAALPALETGELINSTVQVSEKVQEMATKVKNAFRTMSSFVTEHKDIILSALAGIAAGFATFKIMSNWTAITTAFSTALKVVGVALGAISLPALAVAAIIGGLVAAFVHFYRTNETFRGFVDGIFLSIKNVMADLWNNVLVPFGQWLGNVFLKAWEGVQKGLEWLWRNVLVPIGEFIEGSFLNVWEKLKEAGQALQKDAIEPLSKFLEKFWHDVLVPIGNVLKDVLAVAFEIVAEVAKNLWENVLVPLGSFIADAFEPTVEAISAVLEFLWKNVFVPFGAFLGEMFIVIWEELTKTIEFLWNNVLKPFVPFVKGVVSTAFKTVGEVIAGLKKSFIGLMDFITGVFTGDWEKAWNGVRDIFKGIFDSLWGIVKLPLNLIIDGINTVIGALNSLSIDIPDWVPKFGGQTWGINIPKIPKLARGGIISTPTLAMVGEAGPEMVVPLENTSFVNQLASALGTAVLSAMQFNTSADNNGDVILQIDGTVVGRVLGPILDREKQRIGNNVILKTT